MTSPVAFTAVFTCDIIDTRPKCGAQSAAGLVNMHNVTATPGNCRRTEPPELPGCHAPALHLQPLGKALLPRSLEIAAQNAVSRKLRPANDFTEGAVGKRRRMPLPPERGRRAHGVCVKWRKHREIERYEYCRRHFRYGRHAA